MADFINDIFENFGEARFTVGRVLDGGDRIVAEVVLTASGKASGVPVGRSVSTIYFFSPHGRVLRQDIFWQGDGWKLALEAAGLSE